MLALSKTQTITYSVINPRQNSLHLNVGCVIIYLWKDFCENFLHTYLCKEIMQMLRISDDLSSKRSEKLIDENEPLNWMDVV